MAVTFEGYERRIDKITKVMASYGIKDLEEALKLSNKAVTEALDGLPAHKIHCSVLAEEAVRAAVKDYYDRNGIEYGDELKQCDGHCESCGKH